MPGKRTPPNKELSPVDEELLELTALEVPWQMVCGEFQRRYGSPGAVARRLFELESIGLLEIKTKFPGDTRVTAELLEADALEHGYYEDLEDELELQCSICTTDDGLARVANRFSKELTRSPRGC